MIIRDEDWDIFQVYMRQAIDYFESYEPMDFEHSTHRDQLNSILHYDIEEMEDE